MNGIKKMCFRAYQGAFRAALPILPYREPQVLSSVRAVGGLIRSLRISKVFIFCS